MKTRMLVLLYAVVFGVMFVLLVGFIAENKNLKYRLDVAQNYVQSISEVQQKLKDAGYYDGKIDGKWGYQTDKAYCNWCAAQYFKEQ